jgi:hypothetical protein
MLLLLMMMMMMTTMLMKSLKLPMIIYVRATTQHQLHRRMRHNMKLYWESRSDCNSAGTAETAEEGTGRARGKRKWKGNGREMEGKWKGNEEEIERVM